LRAGKHRRQRTNSSQQVLADSLDGSSSTVGGRNSYSRDDSWQRSISRSLSQVSVSNRTPRGGWSMSKASGYRMMVTRSAIVSYTLDD
jgi:hypothetical protein